MKFNEEAHIYVNDKGEVYTSATSFIKKFYKPFDRINIAKKFAKKNKRTVEDVLEEWDKAGKDAIVKGTAYHKLEESRLLLSEDILIENESHPVIKPEFDGEYKINNKLKLDPGVYPELILWSDKYKIAGQADRVEITKSGKINVLDYKTSKEIKTEAFRRWDGSYDRMLGPFSHLDDCNFWHYAIQLNLYAFLIKQHNRGYKIGNLSIHHVICDYEDGNLQVNDIVDYDVPNLQIEVKNALEQYKQGNDKSFQYRIG